MLNNITIGKYYPVRSRVHLMNPLSKIICTITFVLMCLFANSMLMNAMLFILVILMIINSHIPVKYFFKTIRSLRFILLFTIIFNMILNIYFETTLIMLSRLILLVLYTSILTLTTPPTEITYGLEKFLSPLKVFKVPVNRMALSISIALRFIPTIIDEGNKILKSQACRGIDYNSSNIKDKLVAIKALIVPMFVLTIKRADELADAMEVRLFSIYRKRTNFRQNKWGFYDTYLVSIHVVLMLTLIVRSFMVL
nr:energy-coupling factor transporter transmembrane protein EcfT [Bacilli bacterium]